MVHIAACRANGGVLLKPHFPHRAQTMAEEYYCNMLDSEAPPETEGMFPRGDHFWRNQDMASSHTVHPTKEFPAAKNLNTLPWPPSGADISWLDIYVNTQPKQRLKEKDLSTRVKLMADVSRAL